MHHVDQLLEQEEVTGVRSDTCADEDAIKRLLLESASDNRFRSLAKVGQAHLHPVPETDQLFLGGLEAGEHLRSVHPRRIAGLREINHTWVQPDHEHTLCAWHSCLPGVGVNALARLQPQEGRAPEPPPTTHVHMTRTRTAGTTGLVVLLVLGSHPPRSPRLSRISDTWAR